MNADIQEEISKKITDIGFELLRYELKFHNNQNIIVSPLSAIYCIAMAMNGLAAAQKKNIEKILGITTEDLNDYLESLIQDLDNYPGIGIYNKLTVTDSFLDNDAFVFQFEDTLNENYNAEIEIVKKTNLVSSINNWISQKTNGRIDSLVSEADFPYEKSIAILNALNFKQDWDKDYKKSNDREMFFHSSDGTESKCNMMNDVDALTFLHENTNLDCNGFAKIYDDGQHGFSAFLPENEIPLQEFLEKADSTFFTRLIGDDPEINYWIPEFKTEYMISELNQDLTDLGIFDLTEMEFNNILKNGIVKFPLMKQKSVIDFNHNGTDASAGTALLGFKTCSLFPKHERETVTVVFDRPFFYCIWDFELGFPLFMGVIQKL